MNLYKSGVIKYTLTLLFFISRAIVALIFIILTAISVLYLSYLLGSAILANAVVLGSDNTYHLSWMHVLDRFWPQIPYWFPFAGGGISIVFGYWVLPYYAVLFLAHSTQFTIEQSLRIIQFLTVPLIGFELYLFGWLRLRNHMIGLLAALLYPLSSVAWGWIAHAGFYSMHVSLVMVIPALIFYDAYLENILEQKGHLVFTRLFLLGVGIFIALSFTTHLAAGSSLLLGLPVYTLIRSITGPREEILKRLLRGTIAFITVAGVGILLSAFLLYPQRRYFAFQALDFTPDYAAHEYPQLSWKGFMGFERLQNVGSLYTPLFLSTIISILGILGILLGLIFRTKAAAVGILALFYVWWMSHTRYLASNYPIFSPFLLPTNLRVVGIPGALFPLLAAYGVWSLADLPGRAIRFIVRKYKSINTFIITPITFISASVIAIVLLGGSLYKYRSLQEYPQIIDKSGNVIEAYKGYGALGFLPPFCIVPGWEKVGLPNQLSCDKLTPDIKKVTISRGGRDPLLEMDFDNKMRPFKFNENTRIAVSSHLGGVIQAFNSHSSASMLNNFSSQATLNLSMYGILDQAFYQKGNSTKDEVSELAKWFGIRYVMLHAGDDKQVLYRYPKQTWAQVETIGDVVLVKEFENSPGIALISNKPAVLVIGSKKKKAYETVFRTAARGALPYDNVILVKGEDAIDSYSLNELRKFKLLILHGYSYGNRSKAWSLLRKYVEDGGSVFIDTGWQYISQDWSTKKIQESSPIYIAEFKDPFPATTTTWGNLGKSWDGFALNKEIANQVSLGDFGPLAWSGQEWSLAFAKVDSLASWAQPVLYQGDKVIIAKGQFGKGKVVWSGMNILAHAYDKKSSAENIFIGKLFSYLLDSSSVDQKKAVIQSTFTDQIEISAPSVGEGYWLYFAQTYTPDWRAYLVDDDQRRKALNVYSSGPGLQAVELPKVSEGQKLLLVYDVSKVLLFSSAVTILTLLVLIFSILDPLLFRQALEKRLKRRLSTYASQIKNVSKYRIGKIAKHEDEVY